MLYLSRQQRVGVEALHAADQLVLGVDHIVHKGPVDQEPIRASVHRNALRDLAVPETPHVGVTLVEETVQTLFTDETEDMASSVQILKYIYTVSNTWRLQTNVL